MNDWDPALYNRFSGPRLRPAIDLLRAVGPLPDGPVIDLGCGSGAAGPALAALGRPLIGLDSSPAMLRDAAATGAYTALTEADLTTWRPDTPPALIFSNAVLHWVPDHKTLLPSLVRSLAPEGVLAVQVPHQNNAPSHRLWWSLGHELFPDRIASSGGPSILTARAYHRLLAPLGTLSLWETEYFQVLPPCPEGHPVRRFTQSTYARPVLDALDGDQQATLIAAYEQVIGKAYPSEPDGSVAFPFRRLFFTLTRAG